MPYIRPTAHPFSHTPKLARPPLSAGRIAAMLGALLLMPQFIPAGQLSNATGLVGIAHAQSGSALAILTDIGGKVEIIRGGKARVAKNGDKLFRGDRVRTTKPIGRATVFALGGAPKTLVAGQEVVIAAPSSASGGQVWKAIYAGVSTGLGARNTPIPATMRDDKLEAWAPVETKITTALPRFVWTPGPLAAADILNYELTIRTAKEVVAQATTNMTSYTHPAGAKKLQPGVRYFWRVVPKLRSGAVKTEWATPESWFQIASPAEAKALNAEVTTINSLTSIDTETRRVVLAALYSERGYTLSALQTLVEIQTPRLFTDRTAALPVSGRALLRSLLTTTHQAARLAQLDGEERSRPSSSGEELVAVPELNPKTVPPGALKTYTDPAGHFSLSLPIAWGALRQELNAGIVLTDFATEYRGKPSISIVTGPQAGQGAASLLESLREMLKPLGTLETRPPQTITFEGAPAQQYEYTWKDKDTSLRGRIVAFTRGSGAKARLFLVLVSNDGTLSGAAFDGPFALTASLLPTMRTSVVAPPAKPVPTLPELQKAMNDELQASLGLMQTLNGVYSEQMSDDSTAQLSLAEAKTALEAAEKERAATPPNSLERSKAARRTAALASNVGWAQWKEGQKTEAEALFTRQTALLAEANASDKAFYEKGLAETDIRIRELQADTTNIIMASTQKLAINGWMDVQTFRLELLQQLARRTGDNAALLRYAKRNLELRRAQLENMTLSSDDPQFRMYARMRVAGAIETLAWAYDERAEFSRAKALYLQAIALRTTLPESYAERALNGPMNSLAVLSTKTGDLIESREWYQKALAALDASQPIQEKTNAEYDEPLRSLKMVGLRQSRAVIHNNLGLLAQSLGDYRETQKQLDLALQIMEPIPDTEQAKWVRNIQRAVTLGNIAVLRSELGDTEGAGRTMDEAVALYRTLGDQHGIAVTLMNQAGMLQTAGNLPESKNHAERAYQLFLAEQRPDYAAIVAAFLARMELENKNLAGAEKLASDALQLAKGSADIASESTAYVALARIGIEKAKDNPASPEGQRALTEATAALKQAEAINNRVGDYYRTISVRDLSAQIKVLRGDTKGAIADYSSAIGRLEAVRATTTSQDAFADQESNFAIYQRLVTLLLKEGQVEEAFDYLSRARSKKMQDSLRLTNLKTQDPVLNGLLERVDELEKKLNKLRAQLETENSKPDATRDRTKIENLRDLVATTQADFFQVSNQLKEKDPAFDKILTVKPRELKKAQRSIPADSVLIQYAPLNDGLYIFVVTRDDLKIYAPKVQTAALWQKVREFRTLIDGARDKVARGEELATPENDEALRTNITALYDMLLAPIEGDLEDKKTVAFIPTGLLYYLPIHALAKQTPQGLQYFAEEKRVAYLAAADVLSVVQPRDTAHYGAGLLALGDPTGANLPEAREEVREISRIFPASQALVGENATKAVLLDSKNLDRRILHLATHGVLNSARPSDSYIQLSGKGELGRLALGEVYGLNLDRIDLVTLSACQTAIGTREPDGGEITSLAEAFSSAGTPTVIASLWSVEDASTRTLMEEFYKALAGGDSKAQALQKAQVALLKDPKTRHPFYWAPFEILGDWR
jgi:CHAT domain-containing protein